MIKKLLPMAAAVIFMSCAESAEETKTGQEVQTEETAAAPADLNTESVKIENPDFKDITIKQVLDMMGNENVVVLDVRSTEEYEAGHLKNAVNVNVAGKDFYERVAELDKTKEYVVYCHSGRRSMKASSILADKEFPVVYNMLGGISQWESNGYEVVK